MYKFRFKLSKKSPKILMFDQCSRKRWKIGSRTTPHEDTSPPDKKIKPNHCPPGPHSLGIFPTRTTPHWDHYHGIKPLIRTRTCTVGNCPHGKLSGYGKITCSNHLTELRTHWKCVTKLSYDLFFPQSSALRLPINHQFGSTSALPRHSECHTPAMPMSYGHFYTSP